jgi:hypothetical protein
MKSSLFKFYFIFMLFSLVLFSCENHDLTQNSESSIQTILERKPENRHPVEPNTEPPKSKRSPRKYISRMSTWC